jgi:hypothetical protein
MLFQNQYPVLLFVCCTIPAHPAVMKKLLILIGFLRAFLCRCR